MSAFVINSYIYKFDPLSLSPALWLDAADANTFYDATTGGSLVAADGSIARWEDKSGNGRHAIQASAANQPSRKTSIQNGQDIVRFDGSNDRLGSSSAFNPFTVISVSKSNTSSGTQTIFRQGDAGSTFIHRLEGTGFRSYTNGGSFDATTTITPTNWNILTSVFGAAELNQYVNGSTGSIDSSGTRVSYLTGYTVGTRFNSDTEALSGDLAEILVFDAALSGGDRAKVEQYLSIKWNISI